MLILWNGRFSPSLLVDHLHSFGNDDGSGPAIQRCRPRNFESRCVASFLQPEKAEDVLLHPLGVGISMLRLLHRSQLASVHVMRA